MKKHYKKHTPKYRSRGDKPRRKNYYVVSRGGIRL